MLKNNMWNDIKTLCSSDNDVKKFVFTKGDAVAEAVLYKYPTYDDRTVICCSTMSGCPVKCKFCGTGEKFIRSLTGEEIVSQVEYLLEHTGVNPLGIKKLQIMFMSMGEPMLNFAELSNAIEMLYAAYPNAALLISTSAPKNDKAFEDLLELSAKIPTIGLQFSVHESTDEARKKLIPTKTMSIGDIATYGEWWAIKTCRKPFFNYCVHPNNNSQEDVDRLLKFFHPSIWEATLSVICEKDEHVAASIERQRELASGFSQKMLEAGYGVRVFNPAGQEDIGGGCGQLWATQEWMRNHPELVKNSK